MGNLHRMLPIIACCTAVAAVVQPGTASDYGQDPSYANPEPLAFRSTPPPPYQSTSPQRFILIADRHIFHNSVLPIVVDATPRVFIRTYDPAVGSYVETEIPDSTCVMSCRGPQAQIGR